MKNYILYIAFLLSMHYISYGQQNSVLSVQTEFQNFLKNESSNLYKGTELPVLLVKENTKGNRYLFDDWVKGSVVNYTGETFMNPNALYNYDKVDNKLLIKLENTIVALNSFEIGEFTLLKDSASYNFERIRNLKDFHFYQPVLKSTKGYSLYKLLITKFKQADYFTNGIVESGNKYNEYVDETEWYILTEKKELMKIILKEKYIKKILQADGAKVNHFFEGHGKQKIDEQFIRALITSLNSDK